MIPRKYLVNIFIVMVRANVYIFIFTMCLKAFSKPHNELMSGCCFHVGYCFHVSTESMDIENLTCSFCLKSFNR